MAQALKIVMDQGFLDLAGLHAARRKGPEDHAENEFLHGLPPQSSSSSEHLRWHRLRDHVRCGMWRGTDTARHLTLAWRFGDWADFGQSALDRVLASGCGERATVAGPEAMWAPTAIAAKMARMYAFGQRRGKFVEPQGKSISLDCLTGDMFAAAQQILKEICRSSWGSPSGGSMASPDHVQELRGGLSAMCDMSFVNPKYLLLLQDGFLALRSEWSMVSVDPVQFFRDEVSGLVRRFQPEGPLTSSRKISSLYAVSGPQYDQTLTRFR